MGRLDGKVAIITGAAGGIGEATVRYFVQEGAKVAITDVNEKYLEELAAELTAAGAQVLTARHDVAKEADWLQVVKVTQERFGKINILINNAGILHLGSVETETLENMKYIYDVDVFGTFLGMKYVIPEMKKVKESCSIVNISSVLGPYVAMGDNIAYNSAKAAVLGLTKSAAVDLAGANIRVNAVHPGTIKTPINADKLDNDEEFRKLKLSKIPLRRAGLGEEVARAVGFLASDEASYIHGASLVVDGGQILGYVAQS